MARHVRQHRRYGDRALSDHWTVLRCGYGVDDGGLAGLDHNLLDEGVDEGWKLVESLPHAGHRVELETVLINGNGPGHHDAIGPTVELVVGGACHTANRNRHMLVPVNGNGANGHYDEAEEPQQSLFSWAEFMVQEPVKPKGRKTQATSLSLFEWAVEREMEADPGGAGR